MVYGLMLWVVCSSIWYWNLMGWSCLYHSCPPTHLPSHFPHHHCTVIAPHNHSSSSAHNHPHTTLCTTHIYAYKHLSCSQTRFSQQRMDYITAMWKVGLGNWLHLVVQQCAWFLVHNQNALLCDVTFIDKQIVSCNKLQQTHFSPNVTSQSSAFWLCAKNAKNQAHCWTTRRNQFPRPTIHIAVM